MSHAHHLLAVWNPSDAESAMDAHPEVLVSWADRSPGDQATGEEGSAYGHWVTPQ